MEKDWIIGMGRIGQAVAKRAKSFGISIHYHNRNQLPSDIEQLFETTYWSSLDEMIKEWILFQLIVRQPKIPRN